MSLIGYDGQIELEEDDWFEDEYEDDDDDEEDGWDCEFGERCLMPGYDHRRSECYTVEMAQAWQDDAAYNE